MGWEKRWIVSPVGRSNMCLLVLSHRDFLSLSFLVSQTPWLACISITSITWYGYSLNSTISRVLYSVIDRGIPFLLIAEEGDTMIYMQYYYYRLKWWPHALFTDPPRVSQSLTVTTSPPHAGSRDIGIPKSPNHQTHVDINNQFRGSPQVSVCPPPPVVRCPHVSLSQ